MRERLVSIKRNTDIGRVKRTILVYCAVGFLVAALTSLQAEHRLYRSTRPVGQMVPELIDGLASGGFRFTVQRVYNEEKDGKQGFTFLLMPRKTYGEVTFMAEGNASIVRVFTQDSDDAARFHKFLTSTMGMTIVTGR